MAQLLFGRLGGGFDGEDEAILAPKAKPSARKSAAKRSRTAGQAGRGGTSEGRTIECPGYPDRLACPCGQVWILMHARGVFFYFDAKLPIGDSAIRAPSGPNEGAIFYYADLGAAHAALLRNGCRLHGGERPLYVAPAARLGAAPSRRAKHVY